MEFPYFVKIPYSSKQTFPKQSTDRVMLGAILRSTQATCWRYAMDRALVTDFSPINCPEGGVEAASDAIDTALRRPIEPLPFGFCRFH